MIKRYLFLTVLFSMLSLPVLAEETVPLAIPEGGKPVVAVVKGDNIDKMVRKAVRLVGDIPGRVKKWDRVLIKVSLDEAKPQESGQVTNVEVVRTLIKMCKEAGARRVTIVEGSQKVNTWKAFEAAGYNKLAKEEGVLLKDLDSDVVWRSWLEDGQGYKKYSIATTVLNCEVIINVPVMKKGDDKEFPSLSMKNMLGIMCDKRYKRKLPRDKSQDVVITDMNMIKQSDLVVIDATGYGGFVIAANDVMSADTVGINNMRLDPGKIGYMKLAEEKGLGSADISKIEIKNERI